MVAPYHLTETSLRENLPRHLAEPVADTTAALFEQGVLLNGEQHPTKPAKLEIITPQDVRLTISEGRYHRSNVCLPLPVTMWTNCTASVSAGLCWMTAGAGNTAR